MRSMRWTARPELDQGFGQAKGERHQARPSRNRVFSEFRDLSWPADKRKLMQPLIRAEFITSIQSILGQLNTVGCNEEEGIPERKDEKGTQTNFHPAESRCLDWLAPFRARARANTPHWSLHESSSRLA
jgi:hypothetical protein